MEWNVLLIFNANYMFATYVGGQIKRSINGFIISENDVIYLPGHEPTGAWVTPYVMDPQ